MFFFLLFSDDVYKSVASSKQNGEDLKKKQQSVEEHESIVEQYKGLIREQVCISLQVDCSTVVKL